MIALWSYSILTVNITNMLWKTEAALTYTYDDTRKTYDKEGKYIVWTNNFMMVLLNP